MQKRAHRTSKKRKWPKYVILSLVGLFLAVVGIGTYMFINVHNASKASHESLNRPGDMSSLREQDVTLDDDPITILIEGIDDDGDEGSRADAMLLVALNPETEEMTMTSIPRDTRIMIDEVEGREGWHKINAAYAYGGLSDYGSNKLQVEKVEDMLNVPIDQYVAVDFEGFKQTVDILGGVTVDVKYPFWEKNTFNDDEPIDFEQGEHHLNGEEGLAFVRMRKREVNDKYPRDERQRQFLQAALKQTISAGTIFKVDDIASVLGEHVKTDLAPKDIYSLQKMYASMDTSSINSIQIEGQDQLMDGVYFFIPDAESLDEVSRTLQESLNLDVEGVKDSSNVQTDQNIQESNEPF